MDLNSLPPEILSHIFGFLHIEDRKNVRHVSKHWKDCCDCPAIINRERFCFRNGSSIGSIDAFFQTCGQLPIRCIDSFLQNCGKLRPTIEFQYFGPEEFPSENTWQMIGEKIHSISLTYCEILNGLVRNIILHCPNLESYNITQCVHRTKFDIIGNPFNYPSYYWRAGFGNIDELFSHEILNELIQRNIERRKMISLELFLGGHQVPEDILQKIFKIFPCLRTYSIGDTSYAGNQLDKFYYPSIFREIINPSSIKELTINLASDCSWLRILADIPQLKLQKLETICEAQSESDSTTVENLIHFLRNQSQLQILKIGWVNAQPKAEELLFQILSVCPELVDLRLSCQVHLEMNSFIQILEKVSKSKLECLVFPINLISNPNDEIIDPLTSFTNKTLRTLKLRNCLIPENYCLPVLKHFINLRRLEMRAESDKVLQTIFQYHIHLRKLVLSLSEECTESGFTGKSSRSTIQEERNYSISRLSKLEYLEIGAFSRCCNRDRWFEETLKLCDFSHLTYMRLILFGVVMNFESLETVVPWIETLIIDDVCVRGDQLLSFCRQLPRLKILGTALNSIKDKKEFIKELFTIRPSLKCVIDNHFVVAYYFDHFTKSITEVDYNWLKFRLGVRGPLKFFSALEKKWNSPFCTVD